MQKGAVLRVPEVAYWLKVVLTKALPLFLCKLLRHLGYAESLQMKQHSQLFEEALNRIHAHQKDDVPIVQRCNVQLDVWIAVRKVAPSKSCGRVRVFGAHGRENALSPGFELLLQPNRHRLEALPVDDGCWRLASSL